MKHRGSGKIQLEHHLITGLRKLLEKIEDWEEIVSIVPGRIHHRSGSGKLTLTINSSTSSGIRCVAKSQAGVQEVFFVTSNPLDLERKLRALKETGKT